MGNLLERVVREDAVFDAKEKVPRRAVPMPVQLYDVPETIYKLDFVLKWKKTGDNGEPIKTYKVYQRTVNGNGQGKAWKVMYSGPDHKYHVRNLERGKTYEFKVTATNMIGEGKDDKRSFKTVKVEAVKMVNTGETTVWKDKMVNAVKELVRKAVALVSVVLVTVVLAAVVLGAVVVWRLLSAAVPDPVVLEDLPEEVTNVHCITLKWSEPKNNGGAITHYTPYYRIVTTGSLKESWIKDDEQREDALQLWHSLKVSRGKTYEFVVTASNGGGESDKENIRRVNVLGVPRVVKLDELPNKIDSGNLTLKWMEPNSSGADIEKYTVYRRLVTSEAQEAKWEEVATTRAREYFLELERGRTYEFSITATNRCGEGGKENKFQRVTVLEAAPMPVQLLDVPDKIDKSDFLLKWKETRDNGSPVTKYTVYQRTVSGNGQMQLWRGIHSFLDYEHHVINLERGEVYEFKVTATNKIGEGMEVEQYFKTVKVEAAPPMPVQLLDVPDKIDKCDFLLKWREAHGNGATITKYTVYQRTVNGNGEVQPWKDIHSSLDHEYQVPSLERGEVYEFKVTATNKIGEGIEDEQYFNKVKVEAVAPMPVQLFEVPVIIDKCDFLLKWRETRDNGAPITKYTVYQRTVKENGQVHPWKDIYSSLAYEYHVFNLERGELYEFKVTATNKIGEGIEDEQYFEKLKVDEAVPDPVEVDELPEEVTDENFIILKWTEPKSNGAPITHYTLYYKKLTREDKHVDKTMTIDKSQLLEQRVDVAGAKAFEFVVTASNSRGESRKDNTKRVNVLEKKEYFEYLLFLILLAVLIWCLVRSAGGAESPKAPKTCGAKPGEPAVEQLSTKEEQEVLKHQGIVEQVKSSQALSAL